MNVSDIKHWVLLRGLGREQQHWGDFIHHCHNLPSDIHIHCLDLPGCGIFNKHSSPKSIKKIRKHIEQQWKNKNIDHNFIVVGLSLGGMVALDWQLQGELKPSASVLINSSSRESPSRLRCFPKSFLHSLKTAFLPTVKLREKNILKLVSNNAGDNPDVLEQWHNIQLQHPVHITTVFKQLSAASRFSIPKVEGRTSGLIVYSDNDRMVSPKCSQLLAKHLDWPTVNHWQAGHDLALDEPQWLATSIWHWARETEV